MLSLGADSHGLAVLSGTAEVIGVANTGSLTVLNGTLAVASGQTLTATGPLSVLGGGVLGPGTIVTSGTGSVTNVYFDGSLSWVNEGWVDSAGNITIGYPSKGGSDAVTNAIGGVFNVTADGSALHAYGTASARFENAGTLAKTGGTGTSILDVTVDSTGVITVGSGTLELDGGGELSGTIGGAGILAFGGGSTTIDAGASISVGAVGVIGGSVAIGSDIPSLLVFSGSAGIDHDISIGTLTLSGGTLEVDAGVTLSVAGPIITGGGGTLRLDGGSVFNGTLPSTGINLINNSALNSGVRLLNGGSLVNGISGDAAAVISGSAYGVHLDGGTAAVTNAGTITGATGVIFGANTGTTTLANSGTISGTSGVAVSFGGSNNILINQAGAVLDGVVNISHGATLTIPSEIAAPVAMQIAGNDIITAASTIAFQTTIAAAVVVALPDALGGQTGLATLGGAVVELDHPSAVADENPQISGLGDGNPDNAIEISGNADDGASIETGSGAPDPAAVFPAGSDPGPLAFVSQAVAPSPGSTLVVRSGGTIIARIPLAEDLSGTGHTVHITHPVPGRSVLTVACFAAGTRIRTAGRDAPIETLRVGDQVVTHSGRLASIIWLGHRRTFCRRHPRPHDVQPVRITAHAFGPGLPSAPLRLSPDHAVFHDGELIPVRYLVNGATIVQEDVAEVTYWHVELDRHDAIRAENLACESYLDTGNRSAFANGGPVIDTHPDFALGIWRHRAFAPLVREGERLIAVRRMLQRRAIALGYRLLRDPDVHLCVDESVIRPLAHPTSVARFVVRGPAREVRLRSLGGIPAETDVASDDHRLLGVMLGGIFVVGNGYRREIPLDAMGHAPGLYPPESDAAGARWRWTDGDALLPLACGPGTTIMDIQILRAQPHWKRVAEPIAAAVTAPARGSAGHASHSQANQAPIDTFASPAARGRRKTV